MQSREKKDSNFRNGFLALTYVSFAHSVVVCGEALAEELYALLFLLSLILLFGFF